MKSPQMGLSNTIFEVTVIDNSIVHLIISNRRGANNIVTLLSHISIYKSKHLLEFTDEYLARNPVSTGEYYLYSESGGRIIIKKNKYHRDYKKNKKAPDIVIFLLVPELADHYELLKTGVVDFLLNIEYANFLDASQNPNIKVIERISNYYTVLTLDAMSLVSEDINKQLNPLRDIRVRRAIAHAIDVESYIEVKLYNKAERLSIPGLISQKYYPYNKQFYDFNLELAQDLLSEAGYADGFSMKLYSTQGVYSLGLADFVRRSLQQINIEVEVTFFEGIEIYQALARRVPSAYVTTNIVQNSIQDIALTLNNLFRYDEARPSLRNHMKLNIPSIHAVIDSILTLNEYDENQNRLHKRLTDTVFDEVMIVPFFQPYILFAMNKKVYWDAHTDGHPLMRDFRVKR
jgi:peptide/nickel transport system substrate-binding protein